MKAEIKQPSVYLNKLPGKCSLNQLRPIKCLLKHTKSGSGECQKIRLKEAN